MHSTNPDTNCYGCWPKQCTQVPLHCPATHSHLQHTANTSTPTKRRTQPTATPPTPSTSSRDLPGSLPCCPRSHAGADGMPHTDTHTHTQAQGQPAPHAAAPLAALCPPASVHLHTRPDFLHPRASLTIHQQHCQLTTVLVNLQSTDTNLAQQQGPSIAVHQLSNCTQSNKPSTHLLPPVNHPALVTANRPSTAGPTAELTDWGSGCVLLTTCGHRRGQQRQLQSRQPVPWRGRMS